MQYAISAFSNCLGVVTATSGYVLGVKLGRKVWVGYGSLLLASIGLGLGVLASYFSETTLIACFSNKRKIALWDRKNEYLKALKRLDLDERADLEEVRRVRKSLAQVYDSSECQACYQLRFQRKLDRIERAYQTVLEYMELQS